MLATSQDRQHCLRLLAASLLLVSGLTATSTAQFGMQESSPLATTKEATDLKLAYERELTQIERAAQRIIEDALTNARQKADELRQRETKAAREKLLADYAKAITKALAAGQLKEASALTAERQSFAGLQLAPAEFDPNQLDDARLYRSVLGQYSQFGGGQHPIVNLSVPNKDLWSEAIQDKLRGKIDFREISYQGTAHLAIVNADAYTFDFPRHTRVELNGNQISAGDVPLKSGAYTVRILTGTHGGPYILSSYLRITRKGTDQEQLLVNSGGDIKRFLARSIDRAPVVEISGYQPTVVEIALKQSGNNVPRSSPEGMDSVFRF